MTDFTSRPGLGSCIAPLVELRGDMLVPALQVPTALITMRESRLGVAERNFGSADLPER